MVGRPLQGWCSQRPLHHPGLVRGSDLQPGVFRAPAVSVPYFLRGVSHSWRCYLPVAALAREGLPNTMNFRKPLAEKPHLCTASPWNNMHTVDVVRNLSSSLPDRIIWEYKRPLEGHLSALSENHTLSFAYLFSKRGKCLLLNTYICSELPR